MRQRDKLRPISRLDSRARRRSGCADGSFRSETFTLDCLDTEIARPALMAYCTSCRAWRAVHDWRERGDMLLVDLEPCAHVAELTARLEWLPYTETEHAGEAASGARVASSGR